MFSRGRGGGKEVRGLAEGGCKGFSKGEEEGRGISIELVNG